MTFDEHVQTTRRRGEGVNGRGLTFLGDILLKVYYCRHLHTAEVLKWRVQYIMRAFVSDPRSYNGMSRLHEGGLGRVLVIKYGERG